MQFRLVDLLFLAPILSIGLISSYTDIKYGKIFNKWIIAGLFYAIILYIGLFLHNWIFIGRPQNIQYLLNSLVNGFLGFIVGYLIWHFGFWSAGDGKLFGLYCLFVPLKFYSLSYFPVFPGLNLLSNLFLPLVAILILNAFGVVFKERKRIIENFFEFKKTNSGKWGGVIIPSLSRFLNMAVDYVFMMVFLQESLIKILQGIGNINPDLAMLFFLMFAMRFFRKIKNQYKILSILIVASVLMYLVYAIVLQKWVDLFNLLRRVVIFMIIIRFSKQLLDFYIQEREVSNIPVGDLRKSSLLPVKELDMIRRKAQEAGKEEVFADIAPEGLNQEQLDVVKDLFKYNLEMPIRVYKTFAFAPYLFVAALISIFSRSSLLVFFNSTIYK